MTEKVWVEKTIAFRVAPLERVDLPCLVRRDRAEAQGLKVIKCWYCGRNADFVDHRHPYMDDNTLCQKHWDEQCEDIRRDFYNNIYHTSVR